MSSLQHLVRFESAGSGLAFRKSIYGLDDDVEIVVDCLAMANADLKKRSRYIFLGVEDAAEGERRLLGVEKQDLIAFKRRLKLLLDDAVEPRVSAVVRAVEIDGQLIGFICFEKCRHAPYLTKQSIQGKLQSGVGFIRRGPKNLPLQRADLKRMFDKNREHDQDPIPVRVGFPGPEPVDRIELPVLGIRKLPSQLAADRLRTMLESKQHARDVFGRTQTQFSRLVHAKLFGVDTPYESHSDESLAKGLENVASDYRAADEHYLYEVRAHKINLLIVNVGDSDLSNARLRLTVPRLSGMGFADRVYAEQHDEDAPDGYPEVTQGKRTFVIEAELATLSGQSRTQAFREPVRLWAREEAAEQAVPVDYEFFADELDAPLQGTLVVHVGKAGLERI